MVRSIKPGPSVTLTPSVLHSSCLPLSLMNGLARRKTDSVALYVCVRDNELQRAQCTAPTACLFPCYYWFKAPALLVFCLVAAISFNFPTLCYNARAAPETRVPRAMRWSLSCPLYFIALAGRSDAFDSGENAFLDAMVAQRWIFLEDRGV